MNDHIYVDRFLQVLSYYDFKDIVFNKTDGFCGTLLPYSNIRPFQKETIRYYNIEAIQPKLIFSSLDKKEPVNIICEKEEKINE